MKQLPPPEQIKEALMIGDGDMLTKDHVEILLRIWPKKSAEGKDETMELIRIAKIEQLSKAGLFLRVLSEPKSIYQRLIMQQYMWNFDEAFDNFEETTIKQE